MTTSTRNLAITFGVIVAAIFALMVSAIVVAFVNGFVKEATLSSVMVVSLLAIGGFLAFLVRDASKK